MNTPNDIGQVIQARRKSLKISQQDLAEIAGVSERTIGAIERGVGNPALDTLLKIGEVLGMELSMAVKKIDLNES